MRLFVYKSYFLERHIINEIQTKESNFNMTIRRVKKYKVIKRFHYYDVAKPPKKGDVKVGNLVSLKDYNGKDGTKKPSAFLASIGRIVGKSRSTIELTVVEPGETNRTVGNTITCKNFHLHGGKYQSVIKVDFTPFKAATVNDEIRYLRPIRNQDGPAIGIVPCIIGGPTINNTTTRYLQLDLVLNSEHFYGYELLQQEIEGRDEEGFDTMDCLRTLGEIITAPVAFSTPDGLLVFTGLCTVVYGNTLQQSDIPTLRVGCAMLSVCEYWNAPGLKYAVAMCLIKYYLDTIMENWVELFVTANKQNSPELKYACLDYKSKLSREDKKRYEVGLEATMEPRDGIAIFNHISVEQASSMYLDMKSIPSLQIDQFEASVIGKENDVALVVASKSFDKAMTNIDVKLGQVISSGEESTYDALISNVGSLRAFIQTQKEALLLLIGTFRVHTEILKNGYKYDSETLRSLCLENATTKRTFHLDFNTLLEETEEYFG